jgi:hypothetical protein
MGITQPPGNSSIPFPRQYRGGAFDSGANLSGTGGLSKDESCNRYKKVAIELLVIVTV